jgi:germination protein, Ger(x)C family
MKRKLVALILIAVLLALSTTGCWSRHEMENLTVMTALGLDQITINGKEQYEISARIYQSAQHKPSSSGEGSNSGGSKADIFVSGKGDSFLAAWKDMNTRLPNISFLDFVSAIVVGEQAAKENMKDIMEQLLRFRELRFDISVLICHGQAYDILNSEPRISNTLAEEIYGITAIKAKHFLLAPQTDVNHFTQMLMSVDKDPSAARIQTLETEESPSNPKSKKTLAVNGTAVFRGNKLSGWLDDDETLGFLILEQSWKRVLVPLTVTRKQEIITYLIHQSQVDIEPLIQSGKVSFDINLKVMAEVNEVHGMEFTPDNLQEVQSLLADKIKEIADKTIDKLRELDSDPIGLRQVIHVKNLGAWEQTFKTTPRSDILSSDINVNIEAKIAAGGSIRQSIPVQQ